MYDVPIITTPTLVEVLLLERFETEVPGTGKDETRKAMGTWQLVGRAMFGGMPGDPSTVRAVPRPADGRG